MNRQEYYEKRHIFRLAKACITHPIAIGGVKGIKNINRSDSDKAWDLLYAVYKKAEKELGEFIVDTCRYSVKSLKSEKCLKLNLNLQNSYPRKDVRNLR